LGCIQKETVFSIIAERLSKLDKGERKTKRRIHSKTNYHTVKITEESKIRKSKEYGLWRKEVYKRDNFQCQYCKRKKVRLNAHHVLGFKKYPHLRLKTNNGITLCSSCHWKFHKKYSKTDFPDVRLLIKEGIKL